MVKNSKKVISLFLSVVLVISTFFAIDIGVNAASSPTGSCGSKATYKYDSATATLTISGTGAVSNYGRLINKAPWIDYKSNIKKVVVNEGITELGRCNFYNCTELISTTLPSSLTKISGGGADYGCFSECASLESIAFPANLTTIESYAFVNCTSLKDIEFNNKLETIGMNAFRDCSAIQKLVFPDSLKSLSDFAFNRCSNLKSVSFGAGQTAVGENAFRDCEKLTTIDWGGIKDVSAYAFYGFFGTTISFPEQITNIRFRSFANNYNLREVYIYNPDTVITTISGTEVSSPFAGHQQEHITVHGHKGSTAESFAAQFDYTFVSLDACNHDETFERVSIQPTCTEKGEVQLVCSNTECNAVVKRTSVDPLGHDYKATEMVDYTAVDGHIYKTEVCQRENCGDTINVVEHQRNRAEDAKTTYLWVKNYDYQNTATCTEAGRETYTCKVEGCYMIDGNIIQTKVPTTEFHLVSSGNHKVETWTTTKKATCTEKGERTGKCIACGDTIKEEIPAIGHTFDESENSKDLVDVVDSTQEDGHIYRFYKCTTCKKEVVKAEHIEWVEGLYSQRVLTSPRCIVSGTAMNTCQVEECGYSGVVILPANGAHEWTETNRTTPTCTNVGKIYYVCENCSLTKSEDIEALGHDFVEVPEKHVDPTCIAPGSDYFKCKRDNCSASRTDTIPATGHTPNPANRLVNNYATCEVDGHADTECLVCKTMYDEVTPALGHDFEDIVDPIADKPGHSMVTQHCKRCNYRSTAVVRHDEWIEGYYHSTDGAPSTCNVNGYSRDVCDLCGDIRRNELPVLGHNLNFVGLTDLLGRPREDAVNYYGMNCRCSICQQMFRIDAIALFNSWSWANVNSREFDRTGPDAENPNLSSCMDANGDRIINAKDYAILMHCADEQQYYIDNNIIPEEKEEGERESIFPIRNQK